MIQQNNKKMIKLIESKRIIIVPINEGPVPAAATKESARFIAKIEILKKNIKGCIESLGRPNIVAPFSPRPFEAARMIADSYMSDVRVTHYLDACSESDSSLEAFRDIKSKELKFKEPAIILTCSENVARNMAGLCQLEAKTRPTYLPIVHEGQFYLVRFSPNNLDIEVD